MKYDYDLIVIGTGSGGIRSSRLASQAGAKVAVVEKNRVGGTCVLRGCVPKKMLVYGAEFQNLLQHAQSYGWSFDNLNFNWKTLIDNQRAALKRLENIYMKVLEDNNVTLYQGQGKFLNDHTVLAGDKKITGEKILISTGAQAFVPSIEGSEHSITSDDIFNFDTLPKNIVIVGGGFIAIEFACILHCLGSKITLLVRGKNFLTQFDHDIYTSLNEIFIQRNMDIRYCVSPEKIIKENNGTLNVHLSTGEILKTDHIFYATGRKANVADLNLEIVNVQCDSYGTINVDKEFRTSVSHIFALGDVANAGIQLTPVALHEAECFVKTHILNQPTQADYSNVPTAIFSIPPAATIGLSQAQALQQGYCIDIYKTFFTPLFFSVTKLKERDMFKIIVDNKTQKVLGVHMVGSHTSEIIQAVGIALKAGLTKQQFDQTLGVHPSSAEELVTIRQKTETLQPYP